MYGKLQVAGNPWVKTIKNYLKNGGVARLFLAMQETGWEELVAKEMST